jgi:hypothetical protein
MVELCETIREVAAPRPAKSDNPPLPKPKMFAHISERELLSHGVPPQWLPDIRRVAGEDTLLDLTQYLSGNAAEALLDLAVGASPKHHPIPDAGGDPFLHPDGQRDITDNIPKD